MQSPAAKSTDLSPEFLYPISGALKVDLVIIPSGETFERACIETCRDLSVSPPSFFFDLYSLSSSSSLLLIPNFALRSSILCWCDITGIPRPTLLSSEIARGLACHLCKSFDLKTKLNCLIESLNEYNSSITSSPSSSSIASSKHSFSSSSSEIIAPKTLKSEPPKPLSHPIRSKKSSY